MRHDGSCGSAAGHADTLDAIGDLAANDARTSGDMATLRAMATSELEGMLGDLLAAADHTA